MKTWLTLIGIGESGITSLSKQAQTAIKTADIILGAKRHVQKIKSLNATAKILQWPSPFNSMLASLTKYKQQKKQVVVLLTGEPLWYSAGIKIAKNFSMNEIKIHSQISSFQLAAAKMGWNINECIKHTVHGRANESIINHIFPRQKILLLTQNESTPKQIAKLLTARGFGKSKLSVLENLGTKNEAKINGKAKNWQKKVAKLHVLAIECVAEKNAKWHSKAGGLADDIFFHDGNITKQPVRAFTLASLAPFPGAILWDIGAGCGSISVEWARAMGTKEATAIAIEKNKNRISYIEKNKKQFGLANIYVHHQDATKNLKQLPKPDAIFIGGGLTKNLFKKLWQVLPKGGRLVANAITIESELLLHKLQKKHGGELTKLNFEKVGMLANNKTWTPARAVINWSITK